MTPRFIRNLTGAAVLTGLALTLACGGNKPSDPTGPGTTTQVPSTPIVDTSAIGTPITKHSYKLIASTTAPATKTLTWEAKSTTGATVTPATFTQAPGVSLFGNVEISYVPRTTAGSDTITIAAKNDDGENVKLVAFTVKDNVEPVVPISSRTVAVEKGTAAEVNLPQTAPDGHDITWAVSTTKATENKVFTEAGGTLAFKEGHYLELKAPATTKDYEIWVTVTETFNNVTVTAADHKITVNVGDEPPPPPPPEANTVFTSPSISGRTAFTDVAFPFHFSAVNLTDPGDKIVAWEATVGKGLAVATVSPLTWTWGTGDKKGDNFIKGDFKVETKHNIKPDFGAVHFGVVATFASDAKAYIEYTLDLRDPADVTWELTTIGKLTSADVTNKNVTMVVDNKGNWDSRIDEQFKLTTKGDKTGSYDLGAEISLIDAGIMINSPDLKFGATTFNIVLVETKLGGTASTAFPFNAPRYFMPNDAQAKLSYVTIDRMPVVAAADSAKTLTLKYEVQDHKGTKIKEGATKTGADNFVVTVDLRPNPAPVIDHTTPAPAATPTSGDAWDKWDENAPFFGVEWVNDKPTTGSQVTWSIPYVATPERGAVSYSSTNQTAYGAGLYLAPGAIAPATTKTKTGGDIASKVIFPVTAGAKLGEPAATAWEITWTPDSGQKDATYNYPLVAYNRFGSASTSFTMAGKLAGNIENPVGKGVVKDWYVAAIKDGKATSPDLATYARYTPEFANADIEAMSYLTSQERYHQNAKHELRVSKSTSPTAANKNYWSIGPVYEGIYLLGSKATPGNRVGPVVHSTNFEAIGATSLVTYSFLDHANPDLSTNVPFGSFGAFKDSSLLTKSGAWGTATDAKYTVAAVTPTIATNDLYKMNLMEIYDGTNDNKLMPSKFNPEDVVQIVHPAATAAGRVGQKGVFALTDKDGLLLNATKIGALKFPTAQTATTTWNKILGWADNADWLRMSPQLGDHWHLMPIDFNLNRTATPGAGALAYATDKTQPASVSVLAAKTRDWGISDNPNVAPTKVGSHLTWAMDRAGVTIWSGKETAPATEVGKLIYPLVPNTGKPYHQVVFTPVKYEALEFKAMVDRGSFMDVLKWAGNDLVKPVEYHATEANVSFTDTLQVLAYRDTDLGATENINALPTLLEFGKFYDLDNATGIKEFNPIVNFGPIAIPIATPLNTDVNDEKITNRKQWLGDNIPVAHYTLSFKDITSGLPGSIGVIAEVEDLPAGIEAGIETVRNVRITSEFGDDFYESSTPIGPYIALNAEEKLELFGVDTTKLVVVEPLNEDKNIAYLTWENPPMINTLPSHSGNIIEFFDATAPLTASSVPLYKVHVAPQFDFFPIPNDWAKAMNSKAKVVARIRTVQYGFVEGDETTILDFNETPYLAAMPAVWADFISAPMTFKELIGTRWKAATNIIITGKEATVTPGKVTTLTVPTNWVADMEPVVATQMTKAKFEGGAYDPGGINKYAWSIIGDAPGLTIATGDTGTLIPVISSWASADLWDKDAEAHFKLTIKDNVGKVVNDHGRFTLKSNGWRANVDLAETFFGGLDKNELVYSVGDPTTDFDGSDLQDMSLDFTFGGEDADTIITPADFGITDSYAWEIKAIQIKGGAGTPGSEVKFSATDGTDTLTTTTSKASSPTLSIKDAGGNWDYDGSEYVTLEMTATYDTKATSPRTYKVHIIDKDTGWSDDLPVFVHTNGHLLRNGKRYFTPTANALNIGPAISWNSILTGIDSSTLPKSETVDGAATTGKTQYIWSNNGSFATPTFEGTLEADKYKVVPSLKIASPTTWVLDSALKLKLTIDDKSKLKSTLDVMNATGELILYSNGWLAANPASDLVVTFEEDGFVNETDIALTGGDKVTWRYDHFTSDALTVIKGSDIANPATDIKWTVTKVRKQGGSGDLTTDVTVGGTKLVPTFTLAPDYISKWLAGDHFEVTPSFVYQGVEVKSSPLRVDVIKSPAWTGSNTITVIEPGDEVSDVVYFTPGVTPTLPDFEWKSNAVIDGVYVTNKNFMAKVPGAAVKWTMASVPAGNTALVLNSDASMVPTVKFDPVQLDFDYLTDLPLDSTFELKVRFDGEGVGSKSLTTPIYTLKSDGWIKDADVLDDVVGSTSTGTLAADTLNVDPDAEDTCDFVITFDSAVTAVDAESDELTWNLAISDWSVGGSKSSIGQIGLTTFTRKDANVFTLSIDQDSFDGQTATDMVAISGTVRHKTGAVLDIGPFTIKLVQ
jgi:hypothetical protein